MQTFPVVSVTLDISSVFLSFSWSWSLDMENNVKYIRSLCISKSYDNEEQQMGTDFTTITVI